MNPVRTDHALALFGPVSSVAPHFRAVVHTKFERLKALILREALQQNDVPGLASAIRRVANEAAATAVGTGFPELVFPLLFEERAAEERKRALFQGSARIRSRGFLSFPLLQS